MSYKGIELSDIDSEIVSILNCLIAENNIKNYIELDIGFGEIISNIQCDNRYGYSTNKYLISLFKHLNSNRRISDTISIGAFEDIKSHYQVNSKEYSDWCYGLVGYMLSGLNETKPFSKRYKTQKELSIAYTDLITAIKNQKTYISDVEFIGGKIDALQDDLHDSLIYIKMTSVRKPSADKILNKAIKLSTNNTVILRTNLLYNDFETVWKECNTTNMNERQLIKLYKIQ